MIEKIFKYFSCRLLLNHVSPVPYLCHEFFVPLFIRVTLISPVNITLLVWVHHYSLMLSFRILLQLSNIWSSPLSTGPKVSISSEALAGRSWSTTHEDCLWGNEGTNTHEHRCSSSSSLWQRLMGPGPLIRMSLKTMVITPPHHHLSNSVRDGELPDIGQLCWPLGIISSLMSRSQNCRVLCHRMFLDRNSEDVIFKLKVRRTRKVSQMNNRKRAVSRI